MQAKARQCKDMGELNALLAESDVELSDDALEAVSGGCSASSEIYDQGDLMKQKCPECGHDLYYWDMCSMEKGYPKIYRMYCNNPDCSSYNNGLWYAGSGLSGKLPDYKKVYKY